MTTGAVRIKRSHPILLKEEGDRVLILPDDSDTAYWMSRDDIRY